ncbi:T9SS type A sorting domain-containing protein [Aquimarina celericrescens]|nr:T9SS type A sorting domain-containing protein [Aquimarina celericrescens]
MWWQMYLRYRGVNQLNLNQLSSGVYVMNISTSAGKESHKIVIQ